MFVPYCFKIGRECPFEIEEEEDFAFVLMPLAPEFDEIYQQGIKEVWEELGFRCLRSDEDIHTHDIMCHAICQNIQRARFIIADMTGRNPNVFYELGLAHAFGKPAILITQRVEDVPFDLKVILHIDYGGDINKLSRKLQKMVKSLLAKGVTPKPLPSAIERRTSLFNKAEVWLENTKGISNMCSKLKSDCERKKVSSIQEAGGRVDTIGSGVYSLLTSIEKALKEKNRSGNDER